MSVNKTILRFLKGKTWSFREKKSRGITEILTLGVLGMLAVSMGVLLFVSILQSYYQLSSSSGSVMQLNTETVLHGVTEEQNDLGIILTSIALNGSDVIEGLTSDNYFKYNGELRGNLKNLNNLYGLYDFVVLSKDGDILFRQSSNKGSGLVINNELNNKALTKSGVVNSTNMTSEGVVFTSAIALYDENKNVLGIMQASKKLTQFKIDEIKQETSLDIVISDGKKDVLNTSSTITTDRTLVDSVLLSKEVYSPTAVLGVSDFKEMYTPIKDIKGETIGVLYTVNDLKQVNSDLQKAYIISIVVGFIILLGAGALTFFFIRAKISRLADLNKFVNHLVDLDMKAQAPKTLTRGTDEISGISKNIANLGTTLKDTLHLVNDRTHNVNDVTVELKHASSSISVQATEMDKKFNEISSSINEIDEYTKRISGVMSTINSEVKTMDASNGDLVESGTLMLESAENGIAEGQKADEALKDIKQSYSLTFEKVKELSKSLKSIGVFVNDINTIAGQTNLLSLNAQIEAARAGDAGRGFAVVASEVRKLSEQSAVSADSISRTVRDITRLNTEVLNQSDQSMSAIESGLERINGVIVSFNAIYEITLHIKDVISEFSTITSTISQGVSENKDLVAELNTNITELEPVIQVSNSIAVDQMEKSRKLHELSDKLGVSVDLLQEELKKFKF